MNSMLNFKDQAQILKTILSKPTNKKCADCGSHTPTWASLDFGVFVCSNCSGAHRSLGPTITRIKSINLDQWKQQWLDNMCIGNEQLNTYWQANSTAAISKKPPPGSSLDTHNRYIVEKYIRRKFVLDKNEQDPLTQLKNGNYNLNNHQNNQSKNNYYSLSELDNPNLQKNISGTCSLNDHKDNYSLLEDFIIDRNENNNDLLNMQKKQIDTELLNNPNPSINSQKGDHQNQQFDQFTQFVQPSPSYPKSNSITQYKSNGNINNNQNPQKDPSKISFDELLKNPQLAKTTTNPTPQNSCSIFNHLQQNNFIGLAPIQQNQFSYLPQQPSRNISYQPNYQPSYSNQFIHNPYIGYAPHHNLHVSYNMIAQPSVSQFKFN